MEIVRDYGLYMEVQDLRPNFFTVGETITGDESGATAIVTGFNNGTASIVIGAGAKTGGYQNSIALGSYAENTSNNQFMIGSTEFPIDEIRVVQTGGTQCIIDTSGLGCTSDERLKTNIADLNSNVLDQLTQVRTVTYNWKSNPEGGKMIGFIAQDLEQYFPQLVNTNEQGQKTVNYANMTPVLTEAIRELNLKFENINTIATAQGLSKSGLIAWFANVANGIGDFFARVVHADRLCVKKSDGTERCITGDDIDTILNADISNGFGYGYGN